jgi:hypothetical protein
MVDYRYIQNLTRRLLGLRRRANPHLFVPSARANLRIPIPAKAVAIRVMHRGQVTRTSGRQPR